MSATKQMSQTADEEANNFFILSFLSLLSYLFLFRSPLSQVVPKPNKAAAQAVSIGGQVCHSKQLLDRQYQYQQTDNGKENWQHWNIANNMGYTTKLSATLVTLLSMLQDSYHISQYVSISANILSLGQNIIGRLIQQIYEIYILVSTDMIRNYLRIN